MKTISFLVVFLLSACSGTAITDAPQGAPCPAPSESAPPPPDPTPDAGLSDAGVPLECPTCETCEVCAPPHVTGMLRCNELDVLVQPTCKSFEEACATPSCPVDWPVPIARHYLTPQRAGCLNSNAGVPACNVSGQNNAVFIDCCAADPAAIPPSCVVDADCPEPVAECWDRWCNAAGICGSDKAKPYGTPCSAGHCETGRCVP